MKNRVKEIRAKQGLSLEDLAERSGLSRQTIAKIESTPDANVTTDTICKLSDALGVKAGELFLI